MTYILTLLYAKNKSEIPRKRKQNRNIAHTLGSSTYKTPELVALSPI